MTMTINTFVTSDEPAKVVPFTMHGAALGPTGGVIVSARHGDRAHPLVTDVRSFAPKLRAIGDAIEAILVDNPAARVIVDGGLHGLDLWNHLGGRRRRGLSLFETPRPELRRYEQEWDR